MRALFYMRIFYYINTAVMPKELSCDNLNRIQTPNPIFSYDHLYFA